MLNTEGSSVIQEAGKLKKTDNEGKSKWLCLYTKQ